LPATAERPKRPRFYVLRVLHNGDPPLISVIPGGPYTDLINAWQEAGYRRRQQPDALFIAGEMCSTQAGVFSNLPPLKKEQRRWQR
jgi:hypothetical protein